MAIALSMRTLRTGECWLTPSHGCTIMAEYFTKDCVIKTPQLDPSETRKISSFASIRNDGDEIIDVKGVIIVDGVVTTLLAYTTSEEPPPPVLKNIPIGATWDMFSVSGVDRSTGWHTISWKLWAKRTTDSDFPAGPQVSESTVYYLGTPAGSPPGYLFYDINEYAGSSTAWTVEVSTTITKDADVEIGGDVRQLYELDHSYVAYLGYQKNSGGWIEIGRIYSSSYARFSINDSVKAGDKIDFGLKWGGTGGGARGKNFYIREVITGITCDNLTTHFSSGCELLLHYDADNDGLINLNELNQSYDDYASGVITEEEFDFVSDAYIVMEGEIRTGRINVICPGCWEAPPTKIVSFESVPAGAAVTVD